MSQRPRTLVLMLASMVWLAAAACNGSTPTVVPDETPEVQCGRLSNANAEKTVCIPVMAADVQEQEVTFDSQETAGGKIQLNGTLSTPSFGPDAQAPPKLPAVLLIAEDGPIGRDGVIAGDLMGPFANPVPVLKDLAAQLAASGYTVLRYDKRACTSCGYPDQIQKTAGWVDAVGDAVAAATYLSAQPGVDAGDLIIVGHGQGAALALDVHAQVPASAVVMLSSPARAVDVAMIEAMKAFIAQGEASGMDAKMLEDARNKLSEIESSMVALKDGSFPEDFPVLGTNLPAFWSGWMAATGGLRQSLQTFNGELLYVRGGDDLETTADEAAMMEEMLAGRQNAEVAILPGLTHALHQRGEQGVGAAVGPTIVEFLGKGGR